jgi:hypothetical protein
MELPKRLKGLGLEASSSREIPAALRFVADPIVRRVSSDSLLASLQQTEEAVHGSFVPVARSAGIPASAELSGVSAAPANKSSAFRVTHDHEVRVAVLFTQ